MNIVEFLNARLTDLESSLGDPEMSPSIKEHLEALIEAIRQVIDWHKNWPVLVEGPLEIEAPKVHTDLDTFNYKIARQVGWFTEQQYVARFGVEAPSAPILRILAMAFADHPDFDMTWVIAVLPRA